MTVVDVFIMFIMISNIMNTCILAYLTGEILSFIKWHKEHKDD